MIRGLAEFPTGYMNSIVIASKPERFLELTIASEAHRLNTKAGERIAIFQPKSPQIYTLLEKIEYFLLMIVLLFTQISNKLVLPRARESIHLERHTNLCSVYIVI